jgi:PKD domain-containing protein
MNLLTIDVIPLLCQPFRQGQVVKTFFISAGVFSAVVLLNCQAATLYVDINSASPGPPYTSWASAATNIQDAVDAANVGDLVLVTNGFYASGARLAGGCSNRVFVSKAISIQSMNGAAVTTIAGYQVPGSTNGPSAIRCIALTNGSSLRGFTLTNGASGTGLSTGGVIASSTNVSVSDCVIAGNACANFGGGASVASLSNCVLVGNTSFGSGGGVYGSTLKNCTLVGNMSFFAGSRQGGGAFNCTLIDCTLSNNIATEGGGAYGGTLSNCVLVANVAGPTITSGAGGGASSAALYNCNIVNNSSTYFGGGVINSSLANCNVISNTARMFGGGTYSGGCVNCFISGNTALNMGGGSYGSFFRNCNITGNTAETGGGVEGGTLINSILFYNQASVGSNYDGGLFTNCCTSPLPPNGAANLTNDPQLADAVHLSSTSPCVGAGGPASSFGVDVDGELWSVPPSIGCDEWYPTATGPLDFTLSAFSTSVPTNFGLSFTAQISGHASSNHWDFGDGTTAEDILQPVHSWPTLGDYAVAFTVYNQTVPSGITKTVAVHVVETVIHYVSLSSTNPMSPFVTWDTAATNIQSAVNAVFTPTNAIVLVSNGVYAFGGTRGTTPDLTTNRVVITNPIVLMSFSGPHNTVLQGYQVPGTTNGTAAVRCLRLTNGASVVGFTLTNGGTGNGANGGGIWSSSTNCVISNCVLVGNSASQGGGGAFSGHLINCVLSGNTASFGGGAASAKVENSKITTNAANGQGGGLSGCTADNCSIQGNAAASSGGGADGSVLLNCVIADNNRGGVIGGAATNCIIMRNTASNGGGVNGGQLYGCLVVSNSAGSGGGVYSSLAYNCTIVSNTATISAGGCFAATLKNCMVYYNNGGSSSNYNSGSSLSFCAATPLAPGSGNITNAPIFVDVAHGDFHLQASSPCINGGFNGYSASGSDLDGNPRISGGTVDIGAYEFPNPASVISYAWLQQYGFALDGSADRADPDADGASNWQEWIAGTDPTNGDSVFKILTLTGSAPMLTISWRSVTNRNYLVQRANIDIGVSGFQTIATNIAGGSPTSSYNDNTATGLGPFFYRVGVQ